MAAGMHDASALIVSTTLAAARAVWTGAAQHGASIASRLHHAMRVGASGFCVYNAPAIAISRLLAAGAERVAYVDIDVHHADGCRPPSTTARGCCRSADTSIRPLPTGQFDVHAPCASLRDGFRPPLLRESPSRARPRSGGRQAGLQPS